MELELKFTEVTGCEPVGDLVTTQEESMETAIPEYCPDMNRIVDATGRRDEDPCPQRQGAHTDQRPTVPSSHPHPSSAAVYAGSLCSVKRAAALLFPKESRENPFEGFSLGNFFPAARHGASLRS